jgi:hypothetical protein
VSCLCLSCGGVELEGGGFLWGAPTGGKAKQEGEAWHKAHIALGHRIQRQRNKMQHSTITDVATRHLGCVPLLQTQIEAETRRMTSLSNARHPRTHDAQTPGNTASFSDGKQGPWCRKCLDLLLLPCGQVEAEILCAKRPRVPRVWLPLRISLQSVIDKAASTASFVCPGRQNSQLTMPFLL